MSRLEINYLLLLSNCVQFAVVATRIVIQSCGFRTEQSAIHFGFLLPISLQTQHFYISIPEYL